MGNKTIDSTRQTKGKNPTTRKDVSLKKKRDEKRTRKKKEVFDTGTKKGKKKKAEGGWAIHMLGRTDRGKVQFGGRFKR